MMHPTIHLNGTSKEALFEDYRAAHAAVQSAIEQLGRCAPNGRDYYPQGGHAIGTAMAEHRVRMTKLAEVMQDLEDLALGLDGEPAEA